MAHQYKRKQQATKVKQTNHKINKFNKTKPQIKNRKYTTLLTHQSKINNSQIKHTKHNKSANTQKQKSKQQIKQQLHQKQTIKQTTKQSLK